MMMKPAKDSLDLGILVSDIEASLNFYQNLLGLQFVGKTPVWFGTMHRLRFGTSDFKLIEPNTVPPQGAMGLETADPDVLPLLNKRMDLGHFESATRFLLDAGIDVRAFLLLRTPFQSEDEGLRWAKQSINYAFSIGVECCVVIPTRAGNGEMDWLQAEGQFTPPSLDSLEDVLDYGVGLSRGRVFTDLWDIERFLHARSAARSGRSG